MDSQQNNNCDGIPGGSQNAKARNVAISGENQLSKNTSNKLKFPNWFVEGYRTFDFTWPVSFINLWGVKTYSKDEVIREEKINNIQTTPEKTECQNTKEEPKSVDLTPATDNVTAINMEASESN